MSKGKPIDEFPPEMRHSSNPGFVPGRFLYGGPLKVHFGHVMVDTIARLWAYDPMVHEGVVFGRLFEPPGDIPEWVYEIFSLFGLDRPATHVVEQPEVFETMDFAEPGSRLHSGPTPKYLDFRKRLELVTDATETGDIYMGRTHMLHRGTLMGESYFRQLLLSQGFRDFIPEAHDIRTQLNTLANANRIVFTEGSSIYSIELLPKLRGKVYMIPRRPGGARLFTEIIRARSPSFEVLGSQGSIVRMGNRAGRQRPNSPSYVLNPEGVFQSMVIKGLVSGVSFQIGTFETAERLDTETYFKDLPELAREQLAIVHKKRDPSTT